MKVKHLNVQAAGCDHVDLFAKSVMELLAVWPGPATLFFHYLASLPLSGKYFDPFCGIRVGAAYLELWYRVHSSSPPCVLYRVCQVLILTRKCKVHCSGDEDLCR